MVLEELVGRGLGFGRDTDYAVSDRGEGCTEFAQGWPAGADGEEEVDVGFEGGWDRG